MTTQQPKWELLAQLGDASPIEYGGYFVYRDTTGVYPEEGEILDSPESDEGFWKVYRFALDRLEQIKTDTGVLLVPFGFSTRKDLPHPIESYDEWFADDLVRVADFNGQSIEEMRDDLCSEDAKRRAFAYRAIGDYHGFENLDSYPLTFTNRAEVEARYK